MDELVEGDIQIAKSCEPFWDYAMFCKQELVRPALTAEYSAIIVSRESVNEGVCVCSWGS